MYNMCKIRVAGGYLWKKVERAVKEFVLYFANSAINWKMWLVSDTVYAIVLEYDLMKSLNTSHNFLGLANCPFVRELHLAGNI